MVFYKKIILFILLIIIVPNAYGNIDDSNRIEVLVNENVITKYDIVQRIKINAILKRIEINENNYNQIMKLDFQPNKAEATPATAITIPPHLITD